MVEQTPTREHAYELLTTYTKSDSLIKHALSVEAVMRHFARLFGEDEEKWGIIGLIHDLDWEKYPEQHCQKTEEILTEAGWPTDYVRSVLSHGWGIVTNVQPEHRMEKVLYTIDELTGLITATVLMRPSKSILDTEPKSVRKKWNQKGFAGGVDRSIIQNGAAMLEMDLGDIIHHTILGMREVAGEIGLEGNPL